MIEIPRLQTADNICTPMGKTQLNLLIISPFDMFAERSIYFTSSLSLQLAYFRRC